MLSSRKPAADSCRVLYVDDEALSLKYFKQIVGEEFDVLTATSAEEALKILEQEHESISVVISDQRMQGMQGTTFLGTLRKFYPDIVRILATAYSDITTAIAAINEGAIYQYISKPWNPESLLHTLRQSVERQVLRSEKGRLLQEKAAMVRQLVVSDRLAGYGVLAEGINHHLRNALVPVQTYLELVAANGYHQVSSNDGEEEEMMNELHLAARSQVRRITDMLVRLASVPRISKLHEDESLSMEEIWTEAIGQLAETMEEKQIDIHLVPSSSLPPLEGSRDRLSHLVRLVLEDELEHLPLGKEIHVHLQHRPETSDVVEHIRMEITDTGPDIGTERLEALFTPFFVRPENPQYLGMNLATCHMTLHNLGGWALAYNEEQRGTVIAFCLPLKPTGQTSPMSSVNALQSLIDPLLSV